MSQLSKYSNILKITYLLYLIVSAIIIVLNFFYEQNISIWMELSSKIVFYIYISFQSIIGLLQMFFLAITSNRDTYKKFTFLFKILIFKIIITLSTSLSLTVSYYFAIKNYPLYYREYPFNYNLSDVHIIFNTSINNKVNNFFNYNNNYDLKEECHKRICIEAKENNNISSYYYICNFISDYKDLIFCNKYIFPNKNTSNYGIIENYINICRSKTDFYLCQNNNNQTNYSIDSIYKSPTKKKFFLLYG